MHPNSDIKRELRKKVLSPLRPGERVIFSLSLWKGYNPKATNDDNYLIKHAGLTMSDVEFLADLFNVWAETGSISEAIRDTQEEASRFIIRQSDEEGELEDEDDEIKY
jgi:hypothetical protein